SFTAHFHLVTIHPFYDGNGRTSRLLMNYIQKVCDLPLSIVYKEDKADYFTALHESRKQDNINVFKEFMYSQYEKFLKEEINKYQEILPENDKKENRGRGYSMMF
ncbi:MAG: Fic family protein, partial [Bacteroidota bacterium]|nr:Fic family protein [Bacteroidota bacterium]